MFHKPPALKKGDSIGIFTPSWPGNCILREKYLLGLDAIRNLGFEVIEGTLTRQFTEQGYRSGSVSERASEFNELYRNPDVKCLIATIGGECSGSLIPFLDYDFIQKQPKIICGYSNVTALHLGLNAYGNLTTFYGPSVVSSFGESPHIPEYTLYSWLTQLGCKTVQIPFGIHPPAHYSNEFIDARNAGWKQKHRFFMSNEGWKIVRTGRSKGPVRVFNLSTLCSLAGTPLWPKLKGSILVLEQMNTSFALEERLLNQLKLIGVFALIA
jgi:muramoyltetrapeptide carboxypeptidase